MNRFGRIFFIGIFLFYLALFFGEVGAETFSTYLKEDFKASFSSGNVGFVHLYVKEGQAVRKGDRLFGMEVQELELRVKQAKITYERARINLVKAEKPQSEEELKMAEANFNLKKSQFEFGDISQLEFEIAELRYQLDTKSMRREDIELAKLSLDQGEVELQLAQLNLEKAFFYAPVDSIVQQIFVKPNEWLQPGKGVMEVINIHPIYAEVKIPLKSLKKIKPGSTLETLVFAGKENIKAKGEVTFVSEEVDTNNQTRLVVLKIDNEGGLLKPGTRVQVSVPN